MIYLYISFFSFQKKKVMSMLQFFLHSVSSLYLSPLEALRLRWRSSGGGGPGACAAAAAAASLSAEGLTTEGERRSRLGGERRRRSLSWWCLSRERLRDLPRRSPRLSLYLSREAERERERDQERERRRGLRRR